MTDIQLTLPSVKLSDTRKSWEAHLDLDLLPSNEENKLPENEPIREFVQDIYERGQIEPIRVSHKDNGYYVIAGRKRIAVFRILREEFPEDEQWRYIWALVSEEDDEAAILAASASNNMRRGNALTDLQAIQYLQSKYPNMDLKTMALKLGMSQSTLKKRMKLFRLDSLWMTYFEMGKLNATTADELASMPHSIQGKLHSVLKDKGRISSEDIRQEQMVRKQETVETQLVLPNVETDNEFVEQADEKSLRDNISEAIDYVDLFLEDLEAEEPTIDQPKELLEFIKQTLEYCLFAPIESQ